MAPLITITVNLLGLSGLRNTQPSKQQPIAVPSSKYFSTSSDPPSLSAISWGFNRLDVFSLDSSSSQLAHKWWDGYQWGPSVNKLENLGGDFIIPPAAISWGQNRQDVFSLNNESELSHKYWDGSAWQPSALGAETLPGGPWADKDNTLAVSSWGPERLDIFGRSDDGQLAHKYFDGSNWQPSDGSALEKLGGRFVGSVSAVSWGKDRLDIVGVSTDGTLLHLYFDGTKWSNWEDLIAPEKLSTPTITSWGENRLDIFGVSLSKGQLYHLAWDGSQWLDWDNLGGAGLIGPVAANSWSENQISILALGSDAQYYYKFWDGHQWRPQSGDEGSLNATYPKGGSFVSTPSIVSWGANRLDIFGITTAGQLGHQTWYGSGWYPEWGFENLGSL